MKKSVFFPKFKLRIFSFFSFLLLCSTVSYEISAETKKKTVFQSISKDLKVDLVIFSYNRPLQLWAFLESCEKHLSGVNQIHVIYRTSLENPKYEEAYQKVQDRFAYIMWHKQSSTPHEDFKTLLHTCLFNQKASDYLMFAVDDMIIIDDISLRECVLAMKKTKAYGFYFRLGKNITYSYTMDEDFSIPHGKMVNNQMFL